MATTYDTQDKLAKTLYSGPMSRNLRRRVPLAAADVVAYHPRAVRTASVRADVASAKDGLMLPGVGLRSLLVGVLVLCSGCAQWGWKQASRDKLDKAMDSEVSFVETPGIKKPTAKSAATPDTSKTTATAIPRTPEEEALIDDTLARLRTLPDMKPEQVDAIARDLRNPNQPMPRLALEQMNALAKYRQDEAKRKALEGTAATTEAKPQQPAAVTAQATATEAVAKPVEPEVTEPAEPVEPDQETVEAEAAAEEPVPPATTAPPRRLIDRVRRARESNDQGSGQGIFGGKVGAHVAPRLEPSMLAMAHVAHKPATDVEPAAEVDLPWDKRLAVAIEGLESTLESGELEPAEAERCQEKLRLLYLAADRKEDALREIDGLEPASQDYWRSQLHSLSISLAADGTPVKGRRAALALRPLREAVDHLAAVATLDVKNVALCKSVTVWGTYTEFDEYRFKPNQEVLLYFELENFTSEETAKGYATEFVSSYEIFDEAGRRVAEQQFPVAQETCQNRRRDYFIRYHMHMPKQLAAGDYTLQLTVEDQKGHKFGQGSVKFKVQG